MLSLLSALALVLAETADAYGLHRCAHHDALPGAAAEAGTDGAAHHVGGHDHDAPSSDAHDAGCTCVGNCAGSSGAAEPESAATAELGARLTAQAAQPHPSDAPRADHTPHFHPFAQAPPAAR